MCRCLSERALAKAYDWYLKAAVQGYPPAQYNVGIMLADGNGVTVDREQALQWLTKAADGGYERAKDRIASLRGDRLYATVNEDPVAWSKSWNLRLPNDLRYDADTPVDLAIKVYRVQLGAMGSLSAAQRLWEMIRTQSPDFLDRYQPIYPETRSNGRTIHRVQVGPFAEKAEADRFCEEFAWRVQNASGCVVMLTN